MPQCKLDVTLEPLSAAYLNQVERLWSDPAVIRYTSIRTPCTREAAAERLSNLSGRPTVFAVLHAGKFCGVAGCLPVEGETFGLFYQLLPSYWGQGVGRAAAEMVLEALRRLSPSATVCADVVAENTASIRKGWASAGCAPARQTAAADGWLSGSICDLSAIKRRNAYERKTAVIRV